MKMALETDALTKLFISVKSENSVWCQSLRNISNVIQTAAQDLQNDYMLKDLVEEFQLNGELLTV